ncbi:MAG TPA: protein kinase [Steroidobacteraceae bacterium]|nr:protein kinase [Steroidobacteraceae bacterium]
MAKKHNVPSRLAVADRDTRYAEWLRHHLGVLCPDAAVNTLDHSEFDHWSAKLTRRDCDVLILCASFGSSPEDPRAKGLELLRRLREHPAFPVVIAVAEEGNELTAVRALQLGAVDYLPKRLLTPDRLKTAVRLALRRIEKRVARRIARLARAAAAHPLEAKSKSPELEHAQGEATSGAAPAALEAGSAADRGPTGASPSAASANVPGGDFMSADFIPGYTIHATIGESEKAAVYVATSLARQQNVAVKLSKTLRDDTAGRQFLEREYTAIAAIHDPCVVQIYDYGVHAGYEYLVMEYLPRGDLKSRMQKGLTEQEALRYVERIAAALQIVHQAGLIHRDLKPPNIMLREDDEVALIDFGLARALDGSTPSTRTGVLRGSPYYMSPEQALGEPLDTRSDFYSLGIMYYEMLTGKKPYTGGSAMDVLQQHVNAPVPQLPHALAQHEPLLGRLLAKAREERFGSAAEILAAIGSLRNEATAQSSAA